MTPYFFCYIMTIGGSGSLAYGILDYFFQNFEVIKFLSFRHFFPKENVLVLFIAPWQLVGRVWRYILVDEQWQGRSFSGRKWPMQSMYWGNKYVLRNFWCVAIQEVKDGENERPGNCASTSMHVGTLPTNRHGAINRISTFSHYF